MRPDSPYAAPMTLMAYAPQHHLPPLAGIATFDQAMAPGYSVENCVDRLKRHHWVFRRLHEVFLKRLPAEPLYELKMTFSLHALYCADHAAAWRKRVGEMREPPLGLDALPHPALDVVFDELVAVPATDALVTGVYEVVIPHLLAALESHQRESNRLVDHPSFRICRFALVELREMAAYGRGAVPALLTAGRRAELAPWLEALARGLQAAGLREGKPAEDDFVPARVYSVAGPDQPYARAPRRDERFPDPYNMGVHAEAFLYDESFPPEPKTLMMFYKRLREIDVPEMMATIIMDTKGQPWDYTVDMTRQLWDEARHAMMGEVGFIQAGVDWRKFVRVNFTWSLALNTQLQPVERHAVLYFIEQGLMPKTGKRFEWEVGIASGDGFAALIQDYDWADEVLHARIGRDWYVRAMGDARRATEYGDQCWAKVLIDWESYRTQGLTRHENWWPGLYAEWCQVQGRKPDPRIAAFAVTYQDRRADLKNIATSG